MSVYAHLQPIPLFVGESRDIRIRGAAVQAAPPGLALVQSKSATSGAVEVTSLDVTLDAPATAGNTLLVAANSDATLTAPAGFTLARSAVSAQGCYLWYKLATGGETTLTTTPSATRPVVVGALEYSGIAAVSPVDQTTSATATGSPTVGPVTVGTTGATAQAVELVLAVVGPHSFTTGPPTSAPVWTNSYVTRVDTASTFTTNSRNSAIFVGELIVSSIGAQTTDVSWTKTANDRGLMMVTFKGA